jgi:heme/copper-type cytochrome/quinol oxidase subunit 2
MKNLILISILFFLLTLFFACGESQQFTAVPKDINRDTVPKDTIEVIAKDYEFIPDTIRVKEGTLVTLKLKSIQGTHGFNLGAFGIDETLDENVMKVVEFYAGVKGTYGIRCSHFCGIGHLGMTGKLIIE